MRVTYIHQYAVPDGGAGGTRSTEFSERLAEFGHAVTLVTSSARFSDGAEPTSWKAETHRIGSVKWVVIPVSYGNGMPFWRRLWSFFAFAIRSSWHAATTPADVIFATSTPLTVAVPALVGKLVQRVPLVFEVRDLWPEMAIAAEFLKNPVAIRLARMLERAAYRWSDHVVALSPGMAAGVIDVGVHNEDVTVIPNACDIERFDSISQSEDFWHQLLGFDPEGPVLFYGGSFGYLNNVGYLVDLAVELKRLGSSAIFVLFGDGADHANVRDRASDAGLLGQTIFMMGEIDKQSVFEAMRNASACWSVFRPIPEMEKNSANKFFDALAAGRPVIINYGGWHAEMLQRTGAGLTLEQSEPLAVQAASLASFLDSDAEMQRSAEASSKLGTEFDRGDLAAALNEVLTNVAGGDRV